MHHGKRVGLATAAVALLSLASCRMVPSGVDPRELVEGQRLLMDPTAPAAGDSVLEELLDIARERPCAVRARLLSDPAFREAAPMDVLGALDQRAREFCDAGIVGEALQISADGQLRPVRQSGLVVGDEYLLVAGPLDDVLTLQVPDSASDSCRPGAGIAGAVVRVEPGAAVTLRVADGPGTLVAMHPDGRVFGCDGETEFTLSGSAAPYEIFGRGDAVVEAGPPSSSHFVWRRGQGRLEAPIDLRGLTSPAPTSSGLYCSGYLPDSPTARVEVAEAGWIRIWVETDGDPVLFVRDQAGNAQCNDDWNNLQSRIEMTVQPGVLDIYVGTFGRASTAVGTLYIE